MNVELEQLRREAYERCREFHSEEECAWLLSETRESILGNCIFDPYYCCVYPGCEDEDWYEEDEW